MVSFTSTLLAVGTFTSAVLGQNLIQNWGNGEETTNYTYTPLPNGRFLLDWVLGAGGNFVCGKGYPGSQNLCVLFRLFHHCSYD
jgi:endo-1,4-beta-xylanase